MQCTPGPSPRTASGPSQGCSISYRGRTKRFQLSERILFAKARLNRVAHKKRHLFPAPERILAEENLEWDDDTLLLEAAKTGKENKVRWLIASGCSSNHVDETGKSALHWAAEYGYIKIVYLLIENNWDINLTDLQEQTPLHKACDHRHPYVASCLISLGCSVKQRDVNGNTPLHRAIHTNLENTACMLCDIDADVNAKTATDWTPLHEAARVGNENIVRRLLKQGADVNAVSRCNATPFLTAIFHYRIAYRNTYTSLEPILKSLIENGCCLSQSDGQWTPLTSSIYIFNSRIVTLLLHHGCLIEREERFGRSLLVEAFTRCDTFVVKLLVLAGYYVTPDEVEQCARRIPTFSKTFLRLAFPGCEKGKGGRYVEIIEFLKEKARQPFSLYELSRSSIRQALNKATGDRSIVDRIPLLPLPPRMKEFLALDGFALRYI